MECNAKQVNYSVAGDLLSVWNRTPIKGGARLVTAKPDFVSFYSKEGECIGFDLFDAARILLPYLTQDAPKVELEYAELTGSYSQKIDTLRIGNGAPVTNSAKLLPGITTHYGNDGMAVGFTVENAAKILLPCFQAWREPTAEELAAIQKRILEANYRRGAQTKAG